MSVELRDIPPAPRRVRLGAVLWPGWPLLASGLLLAVYGGLFTAMLWSGSQGRFALTDRALDAAAERIVGEVRSIEPVRRSWTDEGRFWRVEHGFTNPRGETTIDFSYVREPHLGVGDTVDIEYQPRPPYPSRLVGGTRALVGVDYWRPAFWVLVAPGLLLCGLWSVLALRHARLLQRGDLAVAEVIRVCRVRRVTPSVLRVHFRFRDHRARPRDGSHWVREHSTLGQRLLDEVSRCIVVHDRSHPQRHRLVVAGDFRRRDDGDDPASRDLDAVLRRALPGGRP